MWKLTLVFLLLATSVFANDYTTVTIDNSNIDSKGNFFVVAKAPIGTSSIAALAVRITVQCRGVMDHITQSYHDGWVTEFWGYTEQSTDGSPYLVTRTSNVDSVGYTWGTFIGQTELKDTAHSFNDTSIVEWKVSFVTNIAWVPNDPSRSSWYFLQSDIVTPNPGAEIVMLAGEITGAAGFILFGAQYSAGYYGIKVEYYDDNDTTWKLLPNQANDEWSSVSQGCSVLFSYFTFNYRIIYTDGQTRITYRDIDDNEAGPFAGPNILGLDGITGTGP